MTGTGSLTMQSTSTFTLSGTNTYSGGTTISSGTVYGTTASLQGAIANNTAVIFSQSTDGTYAGVLSGTGSLSKTGAGNVTLDRYQYLFRRNERFRRHTDAFERRRVDDSAPVSISATGRWPCRRRKPSGRSPASAPYPWDRIR